MAKYVIYNGEHEWSALYVDGKLKQVGDHYLVDERLRELVGVEEREGDAFMLGGEHYEDVARTLAEAEAFAAAEEEKLTPEEAERERLKAEGIREWIATWPYEENDGTFLASVARDGLEKAKSMETPARD